MITETHFPSRFDHFKSNFQPLNPSLLIKKDKKPGHHETNKKYCVESYQCFDNAAFDLDSLENAEPGSRRPLVGTHERTMSAEDFVKSTLVTNSSRPKIEEGSMKHNYRGIDSINDKKSTLISCSAPNSPIKSQNNILCNNNYILPIPFSFENDNKNCYLVNTIETTKQPWEGHHPNLHRLSIICNKTNNKSLPSNWKEKTGKLETKKSELSSPLNYKDKLATSISKTMVRVGCGTSDETQPFSQSLNVGSPFKVVISDTGTKCSASSTTLKSDRDPGSVCVAGKNTRNVLITHSYPSSTHSSTFAPSVVSALSKVSSVRIVPSPSDTPTPSVIGISPSARPSEGTVNLAAPVSGTSSVKSSHSSRAIQAVKRHLTNIKNGMSEGSKPSSSGVQEQNRRNGGESISSTFLGGLFQGVIPSKENVGTISTADTDTSPTPKPPDPNPPSGDEVTRETVDHPSDQEASQRVERERRRARRERRRGRRAQRTATQTNFNGPQTTDICHDQRGPTSHLPDLLNSHIPPHYNVGANAPRNMGGIIGPVPSVGPPPISLQVPPTHPPGAPLPPMAPFPPAGGPHVSPIRGPIPENPWVFLSSRRSRGSRRDNTLYLGEEEAKSCCGLLVTQAVSIRWFIIMIAFVGLCCTVVGTVLGAVKTSNSEYITITLLMIGVGIVLITVSGIAWHLTSRDAPCRVMLGLSPGDSGREGRRFIGRIAPSFGRPHHPYAAMMYPEFQYRPPPPSYQASMQEYRLRLFLLDRQNANHGPPYSGVNSASSPPPTYRSAPMFARGNGILPSFLTRDNDGSRPPSYRSREGSVNQNPEPGALSEDPGGGHDAPIHSREPSYLSFISRGDSSHRNKANQDKGSSKRSKHANESGIIQGIDVEKPPELASNVVDLTSKDDNTVTIVQTTNSSRVIAPESIVVNVPVTDSGTLRSNQSNNGTEISVLAHL